MKRHESIIPLSHDHHVGLLFCWKLRQGIRKAIELKRILPYVVYIWKDHLAPHFKEEETILFIGKEQDKLVMQALAEHTIIKKMILGTNDDSNADYYAQLADAVDNHIRFEERILFPHLENSLSENELITIGKQLGELHQETNKDNYSDDFWGK